MTALTYGQSSPHLAPVFFLTGYPRGGEVTGGSAALARPHGKPPKTSLPKHYAADVASVTASSQQPQERCLGGSHCGRDIARSGIGGRSRCEGRARWSSMMRSKRSDNTSAFPSMASATAFRVAPRLSPSSNVAAARNAGRRYPGRSPARSPIGLSKVAFRGSLHLNLQAGFSVRQRPPG